jgi:histone H3/H4
MTELSISAMERIIKKAGAERVSREAAEYLAEVLEEIASDIASQAIMFAQHAGRKTVRVEDIKLATRA